ncbi:uncharacterized protein LOC109791045 isoform X2 [Cajanus cajan]|uniref:uncharacterized protein LOC109791045 isoform X2 n=1 Tax=Cajanus cajan TaxID=3821 RepID=UPI0010FB288C|nr:uncharacterized protein LOC109791045 isoform X2 [Cajanus cajan]
MLGTTFARGRRENRFCNPVHLNRSALNVRSDPQNSVPENRTGLFEPEAVSSCEPVLNRLSNLERFLQAITPSVPAQYLSKRTTRGFRSGDVESQPYFLLDDLWESFKEWSAYGAGVPLVLNDNDSVVQYYVPYLSGIQIYSATVKPSIQSSDGSSDCEPERRFKCSREHRSLLQLSDEVRDWMGRLSLGGDHLDVPLDGFSSDDGESFKSQGYLLFEYFEKDPPFSREPLADKILDLAFGFPQLATLRSCDILPSSWLSVAWYPIYRIPTGPTLKDLDACFLTYHSLYTPVGGSQGVQSPAVSHPIEMDGVPKMPLPVLGLASYKFKGSMWTPNVGREHQLASSLVQAADSWLRLLRVDHPDFVFFNRRR